MFDSSQLNTTVDTFDLCNNIVLLRKRSYQITITASSLTDNLSVTISLMVGSNNFCKSAKGENIRNAQKMFKKEIKIKGC